MPADLNALISLMPLAAQLSLTLQEAGPDRVAAPLARAPHLCTSGGVLHGGVPMSVAETAGALVTFLGLAEDSATATITSTAPLFRSRAARYARWRSRCTAGAPR